MQNEPSPQRQRTLALQKRSFELSCNVVKAYPKEHRLDEPSRLIWRQLIKAVTSSTFNLEEADAASSDADFVSKMRIALREAKETRVAIRLLTACELTGARAVGKYEDEANQMASIFSSIVKNKRANMRKKPPS